MDLFQQWLEKKNNSSLIKRALTDKSYKKVYQKDHHEELHESYVNFELATYGDAILKITLLFLKIVNVN